MSEGIKIFWGAVGSLIVAFLAAVFGYLIRDSFDGPNISVDNIQYELTREQCRITPSNLYRFKTAHPLRRYIEEVVPWSFAREIRDNQIEYIRVESLLRHLPDRKKYIESELPFVEQQAVTLKQFIDSGNEQDKEGARDAIAYIAGQKLDSKDATESLQQLNSQFASNPTAFSRSVHSSLIGKMRSLRQEVEVINSVTTELKKCYEAGTPAHLPMVGNDLSKMPNVQFEVNTSNQGKTQGRLSHAVIFKANNYSINLIGQNPRYNTSTNVNAWARLDAHETDSLAYSVDRVRNEVNSAKDFYHDLTSDQGITGIFEFKDISGKVISYSVEKLKPSN